MNADARPRGRGARDTAQARDRGRRRRWPDACNRPARHAICASLLLPLLSLAVGCTDAASDDPGAAALPTTSGAFRGAYAVPVPPELAAAATFAVNHLDWTVVGDTVTLHYDLPVGLVGGDVRVDLTGRLAPGATEVVLTGPAGTGTCTSDGQRLTCVEQFTGLGALPRDMALVERAAAAEYAGPVANRVAVATVFGQPDPIGIATLELTQPVVED